MIRAAEDTYRKYAEAASEILRDGHDRACVVELAAVVGRREEREQVPAREELVAVLYDLVSAYDQRTVVLAQETAHDVSAEHVAHASVVLAPADHTLEQSRGCFTAACDRHITIGHSGYFLRNSRP